MSCTAAQEMADYIEKNMILKGLELPKTFVQEQPQEVMVTQDKGKEVGMVAESRAGALKSKAKSRTSKRKVEISRPKKKEQSASMSM